MSRLITAILAALLVSLPSIAQAHGLVNAYLVSPGVYAGSIIQTDGSILVSVVAYEGGSPVAYGTVANGSYEIALPTGVELALVCNLVGWRNNDSVRLRRVNRLRRYVSRAHVRTNNYRVPDRLPRGRGDHARSRAHRAVRSGRAVLRLQRLWPALLRPSPSLSSEERSWHQVMGGWDLRRCPRKTPPTSIDCRWP